MSGAFINDPYIKAESMAGRMGARLLAIVAEGDRGRVFLPPTEEQEHIAGVAQPDWQPDQPMNRETSDLVSGRGYGFFIWSDLFTSRQLAALTTFADLVTEGIERVERDFTNARASVSNEGETSGASDIYTPLRDGGDGSTAYAQGVGVYLGLSVSRTTNTINRHAVWSQSREQSVNMFSRQAIPMTWDFPEVNPFSDGAAGDFGKTTVSVSKTIIAISDQVAKVVQSDANTQSISMSKVVSTDPPYYDNVAYGDLSDFFYVWLRRSLRSIYPGLFSTLAVPKAEELVATQYRHESKEIADEFFLHGMTRAMKRLVKNAHDGFPVTIYYAFKQSEKKRQAGILSTGWETFLDAVIQAGFSISGTWPIRTERPTGVKAATNALASSIILVCRGRAKSAPLATRREFVATLREELPGSVADLQSGNIAPVDLAQAAIGPGMAVFTRYARVLDAQGKRVSVGDALALINQTLDEVLAEQEGEFDPDTRWALAWFEQEGFAEGEYGVAETLSKAKNTSIDGIVEGGILASKGGKVRLLRPNEMASEWDPTADTRLTVWEAVHYLVHTLESGGESTAATLVHQLGGIAETARELAYRLYTICERKNRADEARSYNGLVQSWPEIARLARERAPEEQGELFRK